MFQAAQFLSSAVNRAASANQVKQVELTPGQVFKGTVIRTYPEQMALVQIGGMQVHAKLEANLEAGQRAWLQVQPSGQPITLKVLTSPQNVQEAQEATIEGLIRSLGLPASKEAKSVITALVQQGLPLTRETVNAYLALAKNNGSSDSLLQAFLFAVKRNLPLGQDSILSLHSFFSKNTLADAIQRFGQQAELFFRQTGGSGQQGQGVTSGSRSELVQLVQQLQTALRQIPLQLSLPAFQGSSATASAEGLWQQPAQPTTNSGNPAMAGNIGANQAAPGNPSLAGQTASIATDSSRGQLAQPGSPQATGSAASTGNDIAARGTTVATTSGVQLSQQPSTGQTVNTVNGNSILSAPQNGIHATDSRLESSLTNGRSPVISTQSEGQPANSQFSAVSQGQPRGELGQQGAGTEQQRVGAGQQNQIDPLLNNAANRGQGAAWGVQVGNQPQGGAAPARELFIGQDQQQTGNQQGNLLRDLFHKLGVMHERNVLTHTFSQTGSIPADLRFESVKSLLLQVQSQAANLPAGMKDAVDTLLHQVTGQQLMLSQSGSNNVSQLVLQIPLQTDQGEETAFVQIEAKKQDGGQLDAENCRLFFNLDLHQLGITMIDVNIVNRIINVGIYNDQPWLNGLVHTMRDGLSAQLRDTGYQLSGLRVQSLPEQQSISPSLSANMANEYKGVDIRV